MEIYNSTPFTYLPFQSLNADGAEYFTLVIRGSFEILNDTLVLSVENKQEIQRDVIVADIYYGEPSTSSLHWPSDLVYYKPYSDIHIIGAHARSKDEELLASWLVNVEVGKLKASVKVHGPREWVYNENKKQWELTDSTPCSSIELRYESASGGMWGDSDEGGFSEFNPIGLGCCDPESLDKEVSVSAPQILGVDEQVPMIGKTVMPKGFGPLPPAWNQRLQHAGTYDEDWERDQHPLPPHDFKYEFYNSAHPDLIYPGFLEGGEEVRLDGFHHSEQIRFNIPKYNLKVELIEKSGFGRNVNVEMDTLQVDVEAKRAYIVWRVFAPYREGFSGANIELEEGH